MPWPLWPASGERDEQSGNDGNLVHGPDNSMARAAQIGKMAR